MPAVAWTKHATVVGVIALAGCGMFKDPPPVVNATPITLTAAQIKTVQDGVRRELKDPTSPLFGEVASGRDSSGELVVCGLVNAKNSFGGYIGAEPYLGALIADAQGRPSFKLLGLGGDYGSAKTEKGLLLTECYRRGLVPKDIPLGTSGGK